MIKKGSTKETKLKSSSKTATKRSTKGDVKGSKVVKGKTTQKKVVKISLDQSIENYVDVIADAILDKKGKNVCSLDLRKLGSGICDFFVICNADSTTNVAAIADNVEEEMLVKCGKKMLRTQGKENGFWIIQDYGDIVVHIFQTQYREFYKLEELWNDCELKIYQE